jgi:hypothetical protein
VSASATAEAYNPSGANALGVTTLAPVAPICVKPWVLPNIDPTNSPNPIFNTTTGAINNPALLGYDYPPAVATAMQPSCINCQTLPPPVAWKYYPGNPASFPPSTSFPTCAPAMATTYEQSIAGCIQTNISCNSNSTNSTNPVMLDNSDYGTRNTETADAVNCLASAATNEGDKIDPATVPPPFEFLAGADNPIVQGGALKTGSDMMVSESLVTVPVYDVGTAPFQPPPAPPGTLQIVGFVQLFLSPDGTRTNPFSGRVNATIINMTGCGTGWTAQPILGNGASPVTVRLISPQTGS